MDRKLTAIEVIGTAIRSEEEAAKFYGRIAKMVGNEFVRIKYEALAKEEIGHRNLLIDLYNRLTDKMDNPPRVPGAPQTAEGGPLPEQTTDNIEQMLKEAIAREKKASDFYRQAAESALDPSGKRILQYLSSVEHGHELMLSAELDAYQRDSEWYSKQPPDMIFVGP